VVTIDCIADLHGYYPKLEGGDLLIVAGDLTSHDTLNEHLLFSEWLEKQYYKKKVVIAGNHDNYMMQVNKFPFSYYDADKREDIPWADYLCDSGTEFEGIKIWGSPWTLRFPGINPLCAAFTGTEEKLEAKFGQIPEDTDILITHGPPYGTLDKTIRGECVGSKSLQMELFQRLHPKLLVCGHIHEAYGIEPPGGFIEKCVNCSHVNEFYEPVNKPIRIIL